jgi:hypothetical protein
MSERLTDEEVAELRRYGLVALAAEVQEHRQRRCVNCAHWADAWVTGGSAGWCEGPPPCCRNETRADWFCGNFTPKGSK